MFVGGEICFDSVSVLQRGTLRYSSPRQVIVPRASFTCSGRITGITASMIRILNNGITDPFLEIWHPPTSGIGIFDKVGEVQLVESNVVHVGTGSTEYLLLNISLTGSDRIEFEAGDSIGYYQPSDSRYHIWSNATTGYISYYIETPISLNTFDLVTASNSMDRQPLIQLTTGVFYNNTRCIKYCT